MVLVIQSYHAEYLWDKSYLSALRKSIGNKYQLETFEMNTKRLPATEYQSQADKAWREYKRLNPDLVVLGDDNALKYLGSRFGKTQTPVVYLGINNDPENYGVSSYENLTGVLERPLLKRSISFIAETMPIKKILILFDSGTTAKTVYDQTFRNSTSYTLGGIQADIKLISTFDEWKETVRKSKANEYDAIIVGLYHTIRDSDGDHVAAEDILHWTSENTPIPPFSFWDFSVRAAEIVGGYVLHGEQQGEAAGIMIKSILSGIKPSLIYPVSADSGSFLFSRSQLKRWDITLPEYIEANSEFVK